MSVESVTSLYGRQAGLDVDGNMIVRGQRIGETADSVAAGATLTLTEQQHGGKTINLDTAAGSVVTLPAATGSKSKYRFVVSVIATSNSHIVKVANASDVMMGSVIIADTDTGGAASAFMAAATSDTITLNRSTTGSATKGEYFVVEDYAANLWLVNGVLSGTGIVATPFSATV